MPKSETRVIISGGGTGGHIFPAIAIADALKKLKPDIEILFVGALGKMEMEKVPAAGYRIIGIPVRGLQRRVSAENLWLPFRLLASLLKARNIILSFKPHVVVGVGGYASGPLLRMAAWRSLPTLIQEQNSYAGITNRLLAKKATKIAVAYQGMEKFFPAKKIMLCGNPVRNEMLHLEGKQDEAATYFGLNANKTTVLVTGGSLGALSINESTEKLVPYFAEKGIQLIWQCGKHFYPRVAQYRETYKDSGVRIYDFITRMDLAYALAHLVVSRAGAIAISELCVAGKPAILVPSPNVAEDHQTHNANALVAGNAALLVKDTDARMQLGAAIEKLIGDGIMLKIFAENIREMAFTDAAETIASEVLNIASKQE